MTFRDGGQETPNGIGSFSFVLKVLDKGDYSVWGGRHVAPFPIQFLHKCYEPCPVILVTSGTAWGKGSIHGTQGVVCQGSQ